MGSSPATLLCGARTSNITLPRLNFIDALASSQGLFVCSEAILQVKMTFPCLHDDHMHQTQSSRTLPCLYHVCRSRLRVKVPVSLPTSCHPLADVTSINLIDRSGCVAAITRKQESNQLRNLLGFSAPTKQRPVRQLMSQFIVECMHHGSIHEATVRLD